MGKTAFLFPGQGSQSVGMGLEFYQQYDFVREIFDMTDEIVHRNISKLCFKGPMEELTATVNLQPAITAVNLACLAAINQENVDWDICAGHSLGEYSALFAAGVISREDTIRAVLKRGQLMHREASKHPGAMQAIVGLPIAEVEKLVAAAKQAGPVSVANHNTEQQIVITGCAEAVAQAAALATDRGARSIPLKVSGAWHSELIKGAEADFKEYLDAVIFAPPAKALIFNVTADTATAPEEIKSIMARQLCNPVRWYDAMCRMMEEKVDTFVEVGPGRVLTGLLKKIRPADYPARFYNVSSLKQLERFFKENT